MRGDKMEILRAVRTGATLIADPGPFHFAASSCETDADGPSQLQHSPSPFLEAYLQTFHRGHFKSYSTGAFFSARQNPWKTGSQPC